MGALKSVRAAEISHQAAAHFNDPDRAGKLWVPDAGVNSLANGNTINYRYASLEHAFPTVDPGFRPFGNLVLVQVRCALEKSGSIILTSDSRETEQYNTQIAKVIAVGPLAFKSRTTGEDWPEGAWCAVGDFVRIPKYQGERLGVKCSRKELRFEAGSWEATGETVTDQVEFVVLKDLLLTGQYTADPLQIRAFY